MPARAFEEPSPGFRLQILGSLVVVSMSEMPAPAAVTRLRAVVQHKHAAAGARLPILYSVDMETMRPPDAASRQLFEQFAREAEVWCAGTAVVLRRPGFVGAFIRGLMTGLRMAVGARVPVEFFADVAAAHRTFSGRGIALPPLASLEGALRVMQGD